MARVAVERSQEADCEAAAPRAMTGAAWRQPGGPVWIEEYGGWGLVWRLERIRRLLCGHGCWVWVWVWESECVCGRGRGGVGEGVGEGVPVLFCLGLPCQQTNFSAEGYLLGHRQPEGLCCLAPFRPPLSGPHGDEDDGCRGLPSSWPALAKSQAGWPSGLGLLYFPFRFRSPCYRASVRDMAPSPRLCPTIKCYVPEVSGLFEMVPSRP